MTETLLIVDLHIVHIGCSFFKKGLRDKSGKFGGLHIKIDNRCFKAPPSALLIVLGTTITRFGH